jgi:hypothetical protein
MFEPSVALNEWLEHLLAASINGTVMANLDDQHDKSGVLDLVNDSINTLPDTITLLARHFSQPTGRGSLASDRMRCMIRLTSCFGKVRRSLAKDFLKTSS